MYVVIKALHQHLFMPEFDRALLSLHTVHERLYGGAKLFQCSSTIIYALASRFELTADFDILRPKGDSLISLEELAV